MTKKTINNTTPCKLRCNHSRRGFSLLELALVLGIMGMLLVGLFQLTTASNRQINNQITAQQLQQYSKATKAYLAGAKRDSNGAKFENYNVAGADLGTTTDPVIDSWYEITDSVRGFKVNQLPESAANSGRYHVYIRRTADLGGQASYAIVITVVGGTSYDRLQLGNIVMFTGAEGASIFDAADATTATCTTGRNAIGAFGGVCYNLDTMPATLATSAPAPAILSFVNMLDIANSDSNYLWRVPQTGTPGSNAGQLNTMTSNLGMLGTNSIVFGGTGNITMNGGAIAGVRGGITTNTGAINTGGGAISSGGGIISSGGGTIETNGGSVNLGDGNVTNIRGLVFTEEGGKTPNIRVTTDDVLGTTSLGITNTDVRVVGTLYANNLQAESFVYVSSDERLKEDIRQLQRPLDMLLQVRGVSYVLKASKEQSDGVIAQEVEKVYPELVKTDAKGYKRVNYLGLIGPLIESVRELKQRNDALERRIEQLEAKQGN